MSDMESTENIRAVPAPTSVDSREDEANIGGLPGSIPESKRDPLIDPQAGDIIEYLPHNFRHVMGRGARGEVLFASRCGNQWFNCNFKDTIENWREVVARGKVTHAAGKRA